MDIFNFLCLKNCLLLYWNTEIFQFRQWFVVSPWKQPHGAPCTIMICMGQFFSVLRKRGSFSQFVSLQFMTQSGNAELGFRLMKLRHLWIYGVVMFCFAKRCGQNKPLSHLDDFLCNEKKIPEVLGNKIVGRVPHC